LDCSSRHRPSIVPHPQEYRLFECEIAIQAEWVQLSAFSSSIRTPLGVSLGRTNPLDSQVGQREKERTERQRELGWIVQQAHANVE
jgi:hypothetical protein